MVPTLVVVLFHHLLALCIVLQSDWGAVQLASEWKLAWDLILFPKEKYRGMKCLAHSLTESVTEYQLPPFTSKVLQSRKFCLAKYTKVSDSPGEQLPGKGSPKECFSTRLQPGRNKIQLLLMKTPEILLLPLPAEELAL